jgi:hypothetical protein
MSNDSRKTDEIRAQVNRTRRELDSTIGSIERRLSPQRLAESGIDYLRHGGAREFAHNLGTSVKQNPLAVVLVGVGLGWLMASRDGPAASRGVAGGASYRSTLDRASGAVAATRDRISRTTESARERLDHARESVNHMEESARRQVERARAGYDHMLREQPLSLGLIGLALGAIAAFSMPRTREEDALMGGARDSLAERAARAAAERVEKAQRDMERAVPERRDEGSPRIEEPSIAR